MSGEFGLSNSDNGALQRIAKINFLSRIGSLFNIYIVFLIQEYELVLKVCLCVGASPKQLSFDSNLSTSFKHIKCFNPYTDYVCYCFLGSSTCFRQMAAIEGV